MSKFLPHLDLRTASARPSVMVRNESSVLRPPVAALGPSPDGTSWVGGNIFGAAGASQERKNGLWKHAIKNKRDATGWVLQNKGRT